MSGPFISFLSDYGLADGFVGICHGVIARLCPPARVIDIAHGVPRHDVSSGALALARAVPYMPERTIHMAIVDPGVGGERRPLALRCASGALLVGPDNGLLVPAASVLGGVVEAADLSASRFRAEFVSTTFHGRDIFAPVAAAFANGEDLREAGEAVAPSSLVTPEIAGAWHDGEVLVTHVCYCDQFGNVELDASDEDIDWVTADGPVSVTSAAWDSTAFDVTRGTTFGDVKTGELVLYVNAAGRPAIAVNGSSAVERLGVAVGDELRLTPAISVR